MKTLEINAIVTADGKLTIDLPLSPNIPPGEYRAVLVIEEQPIEVKKRPKLNFPVDNVGPWPANLSLRREDMYDERA